MINLVPVETKAQIKAARVNVILLRYTIMLIMAGVFLVLISATVYFVLIVAKANAETKITENTQKTSGYTSVQAQATSFRTNLQTAKIILDKEVSYTKVLIAFSSAMPEGVIVQSLDLESSKFGTPTTLIFYARDNQAALDLKTSFQNSSIFTDVSIESLETGLTTTPGYPYTVNLRLTISKEAAR